MSLTRATQLIVTTINGAMSDQAMIDVCPIAFRVLVHDKFVENFGQVFWHRNLTVLEVMEKAALKLHDLESVAAFIALLYLTTKWDFESRIDKLHFLASANAGLMKPICEMVDVEITDIVAKHGGWARYLDGPLCLECVTRCMYEMCCDYL